MKIIDFHAHTFPGKIANRALTKLSGNSHTKAFSDGTAEGLLSKMKSAGISTSVILPVATSVAQVEKVNEASARLNEEYDGQGLISFGCIHPDCEDYREQLGRFPSLGLKGVKLHPVFVNSALTDIKFMRIIDRAAELGLVVVTHMGFDVGFPGVNLCSPEMAREVIEKIGDFDFVLAHMGGWHMWDKVATYLSDTSCYLDTSFSTGKLYSLSHENTPRYDGKLLDEESFMALYKKIGPERIVFGTDSPWTEPKNEISFIENLPISEEDRSLIFYKNAERLLQR